jgi:hypothetical protein
VKNTTSALSFEKGAGVVNQNQHHPLDTSADAATAMTDSLVLTQGRTNQLVLDPLSIPHHAPPPPTPPPPPPGHVQQLPTQTAHLDTFSHVVRCVFLLQQDNVLCQALLDLWGVSYNPCTIYVLLTAPLDTLTINYGGTSSAHPFSNAYKNLITQFQEMYMYAICNSQPAWSDHNIFYLTSFHLDGYCMLLTYHHEWLPPCAPFPSLYLCSCMSSFISGFT